jgi:hypothetical protein
MSTRAVHENLRVVEVPIPYAERLGRSKLNVVRDGVRFTNSIVWTALSYNPVRVLGSIGLAALGAAGAIALVIVLMRLSGVTTLDAVGVLALFVGLVLGVAGVSAFSLGAMFNYLTSLFHKQPVHWVVRQAHFRPPAGNSLWLDGSGVYWCWCDRWNGQFCARHDGLGNHAPVDVYVRERGARRDRSAIGIVVDHNAHPGRIGRT